MLPSERLSALGISLAPATTPLGNYVPAKVVGNLIFLAGHLAKQDGEVVRGKVGQDLWLDNARLLARNTALDLLSSAAAVAGGLDNIAGVVKITGFVNSAVGFTEQPAVLNGASQILVEIFGDAGRHARSAVGVAELPLGAALEIEGIFELVQRS